MRLAVGGVDVLPAALYVGRGFSNALSIHDAYVVDPALFVARTPSAPAVSGTWATPYRELGSGGRRWYLEWLASQCRDMGAPVEFMRLYVGGLSVRAWVDRPDDADAVAEAARLARLYAGDKRGEFPALLVALSGVSGMERGQRPLDNSDWALSREMPLAVRLRIADLVARKVRIGEQDAWLWASHAAKAAGSMALQDAPMRQMFRQVFSERFPSGYLSAPCAKTAAWTAVMPDGLQAVKLPVPLWARGLGDPASAPGLVDDLAAVHAECRERLKAYSKHAGKAGAASELAAASALPKNVFSAGLSERFTNFRATLDGALSRHGIVVSKCANVFRVLDLPHGPDGKMTPSVVRMISTALDKMDIGFEPDSRHGPSGFQDVESVVFFKGEDGLPVVPSADFLAHQAIADFAATLPGFAVHELEKSLFDLRRPARIDDRDRVRLAAYARHAFVNAESGYKALRPARLGEDGKRSAAALAQALAAALRPGISVLPFFEKFVARMGGDPKVLHAALHRVADDGPVSVMPGARERVVAIARPGAGIELDMAKVAAVAADTESVAGMLAEIFVEDDAAVLVAPIAIEAAFEGLEPELSGFLVRMMVQGRIARGDFEAAMRAAGHLPDGALEMMNEWAFDAIGMAAIEDEGGHVAVSADAAGQLDAIRRDV